MRSVLPRELLTSSASYNFVYFSCRPVCASHLLYHASSILSKGSNFPVEVFLSNDLFNPKPTSFQKKPLRWVCFSSSESAASAGATGGGFGPLMIRMGFGGILNFNCNKEPPQPYSNYQGLYIKGVSAHKSMNPKS